MMLICKIIKREFYCIGQDATISQAIEMMEQNKNGFIVFTKNNKVIGVLTERDLLSYILKNQDYNQLAYQYAKKEIITFQKSRTIEYILTSLMEFEIRRVIIVDKNNNFAGVTTQGELIRHIDSEAYKVKMKLFNLKNLHTLITQDINRTINDTFKCMKKHNIGSVIITKEEQPVGIITERDIVKIIKENKNINDKVSDIMSSPIIYADINSTIEETLIIMKQHNIQRIVILDTDNKYKILGIRDIFHIIKGNYNNLIEKKLQQSKNILNSIHEAIIEVLKINNEYIIQWCNQKAFDIFGNNIIDKNINIVIESKLLSTIIDSIANNCNNFEQKIQIKDFFYKLTCISNYEINESSFRLFFIDISEIEELNQNLQDRIDEKTKTLQDLNSTLEQKIKDAVEQNEKILEKLHRSEKMASMGEMMGNIAHQWRQPLSIISTSATGMLMQKEYGILNDDCFVKGCETINNNTQYLSTTIDDFRNFMQGDSKIINFNLKNTFDSFLNLVDSTIKNNNIELILDIQKDINIKGYPNELIQCFINIFNNAKDALVEHNKEDERYIFITLKIVDNDVVIIFTDNAEGINNSVLPKIFEPYFTTKHQSLGTGLGLHMTYKLIVNGMGGTIEAQNTNFKYKDKEYTGAIFTIKFSLVSKIS